jgi:photosystem II stability/assembly factor-like uncharacterized protein
MDRSTFVISDPEQYALRHHPDRRFRGGKVADFCASQPNRWAAVSTGQVMLSSDHGQSWDWAPARPGGDKVRVKTAAVAAGDPDVMAAITDNRQLYWTEDGGRNWQSAALPYQPGDAANLEADRVAPQTFYWYDNKLGFLASTDGGKSWSVRVQMADLPTLSVRQLATDYQRTGHLLACWGMPGREGGVARSTDGGKTWERIATLEQGWVCSFGKSRIDGGPSTMYVRGICAAQVGIWRSIDDGKTWQMIGDHPRGIYHQGEHMWADWEQFGFVYLALRGNGFAYGHPVDTTSADQ